MRFPAAVAIAAMFVTLAVSAGASISLKPGPQLWVYSTRGDIESVKSLVSSNAFDKDVLGRALYHTVRRGRTEKPEEDLAILRLLFSYGADVNYRAMNGQTPLISATIARYPEAVRLLLENGADAAIPDLRGKKAADYADGPGQDAALAQLLGNPPPPNPVEKIRQMNSPKIVNLDLTMDGTVVTMTYDLLAPLPACVAVIGSMDKGAHYDMKFAGASGDVGRNVVPGGGKKIFWRSNVDYPTGFSDADVLIDVVAKPCN